MLQKMRDNSKGAVAGLLIGFLVIIFALSGAEALFSSRSGPKPVVTVNSEDVSELQLERAIEQQKQQMKLFIYMSPIMIMFISFSVMAALPLYWAVGGLLLIFQTYLGRKFYYKEVQPATPTVKEDEAEKIDEKKAEKNVGKKVDKKDEK